MTKPTFDELWELETVDEWIADVHKGVEYPVKIYLIDGIYWKFSYACDPTWGVCEGSEEIAQVEPHQVTTTEYREVKC